MPILPQKGLKEKAKALIIEESTLTLATSIDAIPWSAPVYYLYAHHSFYFFSNPSAKHIQHHEIIPAAASIFPKDIPTWKKIRGIQMSGTIRKKIKKQVAFQIVKQYADKYSFIKAFFSVENFYDLSLFKKRFKADLYVFIPDEIYYLDNDIHFGFREKVSWNNE